MLKKEKRELTVSKKMRRRFQPKTSYCLNCIIRVEACQWFPLLNPIWAFTFFIFPIAIQQMVKINRYIKSTLIIQNIYCVTGESSIFKPLAWTRIKYGCPNLSLAKFVISWTFKHCSSFRKYYILMWLPIRIRIRITHLKF